MKWSGFAGFVVIALTASCGNETARPAAPPDHAAVPPAVAPVATVAEVEKGAAVVAPPALVAPTAAVEKSAAEAGKPSAPIKVTAQLRPAAADLDVVFASDATGVTIKVWGVDGLRVKSAAPVSVGSVKSGQTIKVAVQYDAPATESNLAVSVIGTFGGREQVKVQSFTLSTGAAKAPTGEIKVDNEGRRVKVQKAE